MSEDFCKGVIIGYVIGVTAISIVAAIGIVVSWL